MAVTIPIISEFDGKGISKAVAEFKNLEGAGAKAKFALQKAALPAAAAIGGLAVVIGDATKAAIEDAKAQALLAQAIEKNTLAGEANVRAAEAYIEATMMSAAVADDQLRPALATLVQTTGDLTYSQELLNTALDISAATGTDLNAVTDAVAKAYAGNTKALGNLVPAVRGLIKDGASLDEIMQALNATVGGAAATAANTAEGRMKRLQLTIGETKESIGAAFLPILERLLPYLQRFAQYAQNNTDTIVKVIAVVGTLATTILALNAAIKVVTVAQIALNFAMTANPIGLVVVAIGALVAGFALLVNKTGSVRNAFATMGNFIIGIFENIVNSFNSMINLIIKAINLLPGVNIPLIPKIDLPSIGMTGGGSTTKSATGTSGPDLLERTYGRIPTVPAPVGVSAATVAKATGIGGNAGGSRPAGGAGGATIESGPTSQFYVVGGEVVYPNAAPTVNVTVNAAIAEATLADKIVDALTDYNRRSGPLQLEIA